VSGLPPNTITGGGQSNNGCGQYQTASSETITIYIDTSTSTPAGTYTLIFTGTSGTLSHSAKAALICAESDSSRYFGRTVLGQRLKPDLHVHDIGRKRLSGPAIFL
jgi:hypothetical protein